MLKLFEDMRARQNLNMEFSQNIRAIDKCLRLIFSRIENNLKRKDKIAIVND